MERVFWGVIILWMLSHYFEPFIEKWAELDAEHLHSKFTNSSTGKSIKVESAEIIQLPSPLQVKEAFASATKSNLEVTILTRPTP